MIYQYAHTDGEMKRLLGWGGIDDFASHPYSHAVDGKLFTYWAFDSSKADVSKRQGEAFIGLSSWTEAEQDRLYLWASNLKCKQFQVTVEKKVGVWKELDAHCHATTPKFSDIDKAFFTFKWKPEVFRAIKVNIQNENADRQGGDFKVYEISFRDHTGLCSTFTAANHDICGVL